MQTSQATSSLLLKNSYKKYATTIAISIIKMAKNQILRDDELIS